jgi:hypothetical protein
MGDPKQDALSYNDYLLVYIEQGMLHAVLQFNGKEPVCKRGNFGLEVKPLGLGKFRSRVQIRQKANNFFRALSKIYTSFLCILLCISRRNKIIRSKKLSILTIHFVYFR